MRCNEVVTAVEVFARSEFSSDDCVAVELYMALHMTLGQFVGAIRSILLRKVY